VNHLEEVQKARAALEEHQASHPLPADDENPLEWWAKRRALIEAVLTSERAAIDAGVLSDFTAEF